ncbi:hypothetical protein [Faecousia sp.]|uniref:hypothetical protein n=1 Tax=Faecousia sp. TaxID=2952921 RepID=UPI002A9F46D9|nr:hypothetical protein [Candidatus Faecousia sp.]
MKRTFVFLTAIFLLLSACAPAAVQTEPPTEAPTQATTEVPTEAPTEAPTEEPTEALPEETEAPTEPAERPEHTVTIQVSVNCDCTITNAEGQTVRWEFDGSPEGDLLIYGTGLSGFGVGIDPMQSWEVAASDSFTFETSSSSCAFYAEIGDSYYSVSGTGVTGIEFRDGYIKLSGSEMTYKILTTSHARERQYFCITGTGTTEIEFPIEDVLAASPIGETYRVERCTV